MITGINIRAQNSPKAKLRILTLTPGKSLINKDYRCQDAKQTESIIEPESVPGLVGDVQWYKHALA